MNEIDNILSVSNLSVRFDEIEILTNINFSAKLGEYISIVGPNGAGKSTLIKTIAGLNKRYSGEIKILGMSTQQLPPDKFSYVPQLKTLDRNFPAILIELVASGLNKKWVWRLTKEQKEKSMQALEKVGLSHIAKRSLNALSGGELQRAYLARAIVSNPKILLLDEVSTGVDTKAEADLISLIEDYKTSHNALIIAITHDWNTAYHHSNKVLMINNKQFCFDVPSIAFSDENLRKLFGHIGHKHNMKFGGDHHND